MESTQIKELTVALANDHLDEISALIKTCFQYTYPQSEICESLVIQKLQSLIHHISDNTAYAFVAMQGDLIIGFIWAYSIYAPFCNVMHVAYLAISQGQRGSGIGTILLNCIQNTAKKLGLETVELIVGSCNSNAIDFYHHSGFLEDRLVLHKNIILT